MSNIISAKVNKTSKRLYNCANCTEVICFEQPRLVLFGSAEVGDKPYTIRLHLHCVTDQGNTVINKALKRWIK